MPRKPMSYDDTDHDTEDGSTIASAGIPESVTIRLVLLTFLKLKTDKFYNHAPTTPGLYDLRADCLDLFSHRLAGAGSQNDERFAWIADLRRQDTHEVLLL